MAAQDFNGTHVTRTRGSGSEVHTLPDESTARAVNDRIWSFTENDGVTTYREVINTLPDYITDPAGSAPATQMFWNYEPGSGVYFGSPCTDLDQLQSTLVGSSNPN
ncbi:hypothetical protein I203_107924 [Kwoniella mangroviensis CBS 8507]|uniref:hypothetical protein n=1 Tax=Kwoniella mangroviensis CBS 8507 TaxID=1296122 RepID=UPI00080CD6A2|nr:uncharacterized protein I203_04817 [Kwoniella mangroviensis CBS 8507]OCF65799.1 hypothetical protein I203_04817 [Kwoniella mangroviensis CBS 8507]